MMIIELLSFIVIIAALVGVWRARGRGATTVQASVMLLVVAIVAVVAAWLVVHR